MFNEKAGKIRIQSIQVFHPPIASPPKTSIFKPIFQSILKSIEMFWDRAMDAFIEDLTQKSDIKLWETSDRQGNSQWCARDPKTGKPISFASELEMLSWMENQKNLDRW